MKIGFVGLGKLGLPCAVACTLKGHDVMGYDVNPRCMSKEPQPYLETGPDGVLPFNSWLAGSPIRFGTMRDVAEHADVIFIAVQTPHDPEYEGITRLPMERVDFIYDYLITAIRDLVPLIKRGTVVSVISTVLPGTIRREIAPMISPPLRLCYNPFFIAMGTTMRDFLNPEFVLLGIDAPEAARQMREFYASITNAPIYETTIENAELIKVSYNTFIGMKIVFANTLMEICHKIPNTNVDAVTGALKLAHERLISGRYLRGGMGDGGGCHPRDNIAMSALARRLNLSCDWFDHVMKARESQAEWLADLMCSYELPKAILGYSFKAETNITTGSPALLLKQILEERGHAVALFDPLGDGEFATFTERGAMVFLVGTRHRWFDHWRFPTGSVVLDPWRYITNKHPDITYIPIGVGPNG